MTLPNVSLVNFALLLLIVAPLIPQPPFCQRESSRTSHSGVHMSVCDPCSHRSHSGLDGARCAGMQAEIKHKGVGCLQLSSASALDNSPKSIVFLIFSEDCRRGGRPR